MPLLSAYGTTWILAGISLSSAFMNLAAALLLIPRYGIHGAALATVLAYGTAAALMLAIIQRRLGIGTLRFMMLGAPVILVVVFAVLWDGIYFYLGGFLSVVVSSYVLVRVFGLFGKEHLAVLAELNMPVSIKAGLIKVFSARAS